MFCIKYLGLFCAPKTEYLKVGNLSRKVTYFSVPEARKSEIQGLHFGKTFLLCYNIAEGITWGGGGERKRGGKRERREKREGDQTHPIIRNPLPCNSINPLRGHGPHGPPLNIVALGLSFQHIYLRKQTQPLIPLITTAILLDTYSAEEIETLILKLAQNHTNIEDGKAGI